MSNNSSVTSASLIPVTHEYTCDRNCRFESSCWKHCQSRWTENLGTSLQVTSSFYAVHSRYKYFYSVILWGHWYPSVLDFGENEFIISALLLRQLCSRSPRIRSRGGLRKPASTFLMTLICQRNPQAQMETVLVLANDTFIKVSIPLFVFLEKPINYLLINAVVRHCKISCLHSGRKR